MINLLENLQKTRQQVYNTFDEIDLLDFISDLTKEMVTIRYEEDKLYIYFDKKYLWSEEITICPLSIKVERNSDGEFSLTFPAANFFEMNKNNLTKEEEKRFKGCGLYDSFIYPIKSLGNDTYVYLGGEDRVYNFTEIVDMILELQRVNYYYLRRIKMDIINGTYFPKKKFVK